MSSDKSEDEDHDVISRQIVDYYRKYSQSQHLPKYFSGTSLSYMPPIVKPDEIITKPPPIIIIDDTHTETLIEKETVSIQTEGPAEPKTTSPTSSITSNKKLEWDNGADIGYNNCNKLVLHKSASLPILISSLDTKKANKTAPIKLQSEIVNVISYPIDDDYVDSKQAQWPSSSSSSSHHKEVPIESSSSSVPTDKRPSSSSSSSLAYLKSKIGTPKAESTPKLSMGVQVYTETPFIPKGKMQNKVVKLCVTKPILVQCFDNKKKKGFDKNVQTSFSELVSQCVQTGDSLELLNQNAPVHNIVENQSVILIRYDSESDARTCSSAQTSGEAQCNSFEYYKNCDENGAIGAGGDPPKSDLAVSTDSSKELPLLAQLISKKQSNSVIGDIDKSIGLLQKLLKSKKYDAATKKRYIKKIVSKIVDCKYSEDSTSSSDLFIPRKQEDIVPQKPEGRRQISKFTVKTFSDEFLPGQSPDDLTKKPPQENVSSSLGTTSGGVSSDKQQNLSSGSYQSWKENKTHSEKLLEQKHKGQGDELVKFAQKERQHQLSWISDEISHLTKLKGLLEKKMQTTTVYMVSPDYNKSQKSVCTCCSSKSSASRNYVIQTEVSSTSSDLPSNYNLHGEGGTVKYQVKELSQPVNGKTGNIEVVSDDKTTNIKVKATNFEDLASRETLFKPKPPAVLGLLKYDTFPRSRTEQDRCVPCGKLNLPTSSQMSGIGNTKPLSFEIPIYTQSNLSQKVREIIKKYAGETPCACGCKCAELRNSKHIDMQGDHKCPGCICKQKKVFSATKVAKSVESVCSSCIQTTIPGDDVKCQTDDCKCSNKQVQTKACNEEKCQSEECKSRHKNIQACICNDEKCQTDEQKSSPKGTQAYACDEETCQTENCEHFNQKIQTSSDKGPCTCSEKCQTDQCKNCDQEIQANLYSESRGRTTSETLSSSSVDSSQTSTSPQSVHSCICCKRKNITSKYLYSLRKKLSDQAQPLCRPCYRQNKHVCHPANYYSNPTHVCNCYTVVQTNTLNEIKKTINDLNELDQYCTCTNANSQITSADYCKYCKCKLKKTSKNRNGIAYMLTFEDASLREEAKKKKRKKPSLEEIKIKIPVAYKKRHKDKENKKKREKSSYDSESTSTSGGKKVTVCTLQEYLNENRPDFVEGAEGRRRTVNDSRAHREEMTDYNKLQFLQKCQEESEKNARRVFSNKEMKEINRRNYRKLPEVQQKLIDNRNKQLRQADRLMAETFNRKLKENVLRGRRDLPTDVKVVNM